LLAKEHKRVSLPRAQDGIQGIDVGCTQFDVVNLNSETIVQRLRVQIQKVCL
jgi:hypothetical protein